MMAEPVSMGPLEIVGSQVRFLLHLRRDSRKPDKMRQVSQE